MPNSESLIKPFLIISFMPFLRLKKIHNNLYCYLVHNHHTEKGPRQKVKKYLGKALKLEKKEDLDFFQFFKIENPEDYLKKDKKGILNDLVKFELLQHGFQEKDDFLVNENIYFNKTNFEISENKKNKKLLLSLNEGFLCPFTLKRILSFKKTPHFQKDSYLLAKYFVEAGLNVPPEVFIGFYQKIN